MKCLKKQLLEEGIDKEKIDKVHMPVGLDIGAETPEEIAVSIAAEMIKVRRGGSKHSLKTSRSSTNAQQNKAELPTAADMEVLQKAVKAAVDGTPAAVATIVKTAGSTPRKAGARMLVYKDGRTLGTIGGGTGESQVRLAALNVISEATPRIHKLNMNADIAALDGMVCGGMMEVFIEPVSSFSKVFKNGGEAV